jgi:hypothetical protein
MAVVTIVHEREMTITHREFLRLLPKALAGRTYKRSGNQIDVIDGNASVRINLSNETIRKIASLALPLTNVKIELNGFEEDDSLKFMARFDLAYQKGGG